MATVSTPVRNWTTRPAGRWTSAGWGNGLGQGLPELVSVVCGGGCEIRCLAGLPLLAVSEPVALAIELEDVDVMGQRSDPKTSVHSSNGKLLVTIVDARSYRWLTTSKSNSAAVFDNGTKPSSSTMSSL